MMRAAMLVLLHAVAVNADSAACSAHTDCQGLAGDCCPTTFGTRLACCGPEAGPSPVTVAPPAPAPAGAVDPGGCAVDITAGIAAITSAAKNINYAVEDCPTQDTEQLQRACADDITSAITDFAGASKSISSATYTCGGTDTKCATDVINSIASLSAASETLISAATDCEKGNAGYDAFGCIVDIFDVADTLVHFSKSIYDAVDHCGPAQPVQACDKETTGKKQVIVVDCKGPGCNANGDDKDCAWCVTDLAACHIAFGEAVCSAYSAARQAQGVDCNQAGNDILPNERRLTFNL